MSKPKKDDKVTVRLRGPGVTTNELYTVENVKGKKVFVAGLDEPFDVSTGKYLGFEIPGFAMSVLFDGGKAAA